MNYTKGEWQIHPNFYKFIAVRQDGLFRTIAMVENTPPDDEEAKANAHLIAAAPLMCGQLQTGIKALGEALQSLGNGQVSEAKDYIKGVIAGNEMALIKAEGREE